MESERTTPANDEPKVVPLTDGVLIKGQASTGRRPSWTGRWYPKHPPQPMPRAGEYVVATKYADGDPGDHFCVGYYKEAYHHCGFEWRHIVVDAEGKSFRANGFRRVERIGSARGTWMVEHFPLIERLRDRYSVWHWVLAPWAELREWEALEAGVI